MTDDSTPKHGDREPITMPRYPWHPIEADCRPEGSRPMDEYKENRWRKKPVVITAQRMSETFTTQTLEGELKGKAGDWLLTGVEGEQYPCDDQIFRKTYEPA